jgi:6-hydroxytryprostatin B O-methyltransferase
MDLQMMVMLNGKERSLEQWIDLIALADPQLKIISVSQPENSVDSIIEIGF